MRELTIHISKDGGTLTFMYADNHPTMGLGNISVRRASNVRFHSTQQRWYIYEILSDGTERAMKNSFISRGEALDFEISYLQKKLKSKPKSILKMFVEDREGR